MDIAVGVCKVVDELYAPFAVELAKEVGYLQFAALAEVAHLQRILEHFAESTEVVQAVED